MHRMAFSCIEICRAVEVPRLRALRAEYLLSLPVGRSISMHDLAVSCIENSRSGRAPWLQARGRGWGKCQYGNESRNSKEAPWAVLYWLRKPAVRLQLMHNRWKFSDDSKPSVHMPTAEPLLGFCA